MALALIAALAEDLGSSDANVRRSAMGELGRQLETVAVSFQELVVISEFLVARLGDWATLALASDSLRMLTRKFPKEISDQPYSPSVEAETKLNEDVLSLVADFAEISDVPRTSTLLEFFLKTMLTSVHAPSFAQPVRMAVYRLLRAFGERVFAVEEAARRGVLEDLLVAVTVLEAEDERDPRNLQELWEFAAELAKNSRKEAHKTEIFNLVESYFPIHFRASEKHALDVSKLKKAINAVLLEIGAPAISMVINHLDDLDQDNVKDACELLERFPAFSEEISERILAIAFTRADDMSGEISEQLLGKIFRESSTDFFSEIFTKFDLLKNWPRLKLILRVIGNFSERNFRLLLELVFAADDSDALRRVLLAGAKKFPIDHTLAQKIILANLANPAVCVLLIPHLRLSGNSGTGEAPSVLQALLSGASDEISEALILHHTAAVSDHFIEKFPTLSRRLQVALAAALPRAVWTALDPPMTSDEAAEFVDERNAEFLGERVPLEGVFVAKLLAVAKEQSFVVERVLSEILASGNPNNLKHLVSLAHKFQLSFADWLRLLQISDHPETAGPLLAAAPLPVVEKFSEEISGRTLAAALGALMSRDSAAAVRVINRENLEISAEVSILLDVSDEIRSSVASEIEEDRKFLALLSGIKRFPTANPDRIRSTVLQGLKVGNFHAVLVAGKAISQTSPVLGGDLPLVIGNLVSLISVDLADISPLLVFAALQALEISAHKIAPLSLLPFRPDLLRRCRQISALPVLPLRRAAAALHSAWLCLDDEDDQDEHGNRDTDSDDDRLSDEE